MPTIDTHTYTRRGARLHRETDERASYERNAIPFLGFLAVTYHERFRHNATIRLDAAAPLITAVELKGNPPRARARKSEHFCESDSQSLLAARIAVEPSRVRNLDFTLSLGSGTGARGKKRERDARRLGEGSELGRKPATTRPRRCPNNRWNIAQISRRAHS